MNTPLKQTTTPGRPQPHAGIQALPRYQPGKRELAGGGEPIKLSSNESAFGASPAAIAAYQRAGNELHRYADSTQAELRREIAGIYQIDARRIVCGNGSDEIIDLLIRAYLGHGDELLLSENYFVMFEVHGRTQGARIVLAPERDYHMDVDAVLARVTPATRMVVLASPNNPTGTYLPQSEVQRLHAGLPGNVLLVLDGAYAEYVTAPDFDPGFTLVNTTENVVLTRTFSKIYGLAALRIGWVYAPDHVVDVLERIRSPFNASGPAQAAAAAAVRDQDFVRKSREHNAAWLERIGREMTAIGIAMLPSAANFYLLRFPGTSGKTAVAAAAWLESRNIIPRLVPGSEKDNVLRITVGLDGENLAVMAALTEFMQVKSQK